MAGEGFTFISVNDDDGEELVVHAGSGKAPVSPAASAAPVPADVQAASAAPASQGKSQPQDEFHRRAAQLAQAEANLENPHTFSRMHIAVIAALVAVVLAVIGLTVLGPH